MENISLYLIGILSLISLIFGLNIILIKRQIFFLQQIFSSQVDNYSKLKDEVKTLQIIEKIKKGEY